MSTQNKRKRKHIGSIRDDDCPLSDSKRPKIYQYNEAKVTSALSRLKEEEQLGICKFFINRFPIYLLERIIWPSRWFFDLRQSNPDDAQYKRNLEFLKDLIDCAVMDKHDPYFVKADRVVAPQGCINATTRLLNILVPYLQATHFFLAVGDDVESRCPMEPVTDYDPSEVVISYKTFDCETEDNADSFLDREDYEFFRDHCHKWSPEKLKEVIEKPDFIPVNKHSFKINIGAINKISCKFLAVHLEFTKIL